MSTQLQTTPLLVSSSSTSSSTSTPLLSSPSPSPHSLKKAWKEIHVESPWHWPTTWTWSSSQQAVAKWLTTLYLFTKTDIHNLVLPACTLNGVVHGVWGSTCMAWDPWILMGSMMKVGVWGWVGLLCIDIPNQVTGLEEDKVNKPFRPLVQGLITPTRAWQWLGVAALGWIGLAMYWDVVVPTVLFLAASAVYNGTSFPQHWIGKHLCNAWGYGCYYAAASRLAYLDLLAMQGAPGPEVIEVLSQWVVMHMVVIFMTISIQDLRDVEGDVKVGRGMHAHLHHGTTLVVSDTSNDPGHGRGFGLCLCGGDLGAGSMGELPFGTRLS
ncbi:hypothetical protein HMI54_006418 [Coelomomyces lativittatus]|nr:hypothetical protein HMI54_006418 [Coelomomyces lativittatus]